MIQCLITLFRQIWFREVTKTGEPRYAEVAGEPEILRWEVLKTWKLAKIEDSISTCVPSPVFRVGGSSSVRMTEADVEEPTPQPPTQHKRKTTVGPSNRKEKKKATRAGEVMLGKIAKFLL